MHVLVYGAGSNVGRAVVKALALLGHTVVAADARWVGDLASEGVRAVRLELSSSRAVAAAIAGCDAVVLAQYDARAFTHWGPTTVYSDAARTLRAAAAVEPTSSATQTPVRILATSAAGMDEGGIGGLRRRLDVDTYIDLARMETVLLDAPPNAGNVSTNTIVRLPALTNEPTREYNVVERVSKTNYRIGLQDAALFIARELEERKWAGRIAIPTYL